MRTVCFDESRTALQWQETLKLNSRRIIMSDGGFIGFHTKLAEWKATCPTPPPVLTLTVCYFFNFFFLCQMLWLILMEWFIKKKKKKNFYGNMPVSHSRLGSTWVLLTISVQFHYIVMLNTFLKNIFFTLNSWLKTHCSDINPWGKEH